MELRLQEPSWRSELGLVVKQVLSVDRGNPALRSLQGPFRSRPECPVRSSPGQAGGPLAGGERGDHATAQRIQRSLKKLEHTPPPGPLPPFSEPDFELANEPDSEEELDPEELLRHLPPRAAREMSKVVDMLMDLPDSDLEDARRTRPRDIPEELFEALIKMARAKRAKGGGKKRPSPPPWSFGP